MCEYFSRKTLNLATFDEKCQVHDNIQITQHLFIFFIKWRINKRNILRKFSDSFEEKIIHFLSYLKSHYLTYFKLSG